MPTGYTHKVADGKIAKLSEYMAEAIWGLGIMVYYRDTPHDRRPVLNENSKIDDFDLGQSEIARLEKNISESIDEASKLIAMDDKQLIQEHAQYIADEKNRRDERMRRATEAHLNYSSMRLAVHLWNVGHRPFLRDLKKFMEDQLFISESHDPTPDNIFEYDDPLESDPDKWRAKRLRSIRSDLQYYSDELQDTKRRVSDRRAALQEFLTEYKIVIEQEQKYK